MATWLQVPPLSSSTVGGLAELAACAEVQVVMAAAAAAAVVTPSCSIIRITGVHHYSICIALRLLQHCLQVQARLLGCTMETSRMSQRGTLLQLALPSPAMTAVAGK